MAKKSKNKTQPTQVSVKEFLDKVEDEARRRDCDRLCELMEGVTGEPPKMWGPSIVGFGSYHYKYESGREGDMCLVGFSPRKRNFSIYIMAGFAGYAELMAKLGKHKTGKACLYVNKLDDVDLNVLKDLVAESVKATAAKYPD